MDPSTVLGGSVIVLIISLIFSVYSLYLNWKQSKVKNQMTKLLEINTNIFNQLEEIKCNLRRSK